MKAGLKFSVAKKAISEFASFKPSPEALADVMLALPEAACLFTYEFGDMDTGFAVRARPYPFMKDVKNGFLKDLRCARLLDLDRAQLDVGTLGGGNHFIELDRADGGGLWLVVHSGSRHTGLVVSEIYRRLAKAYCAGVPEGTLLDLFLSYANGSAKRDNLAKLTEALTAAERTAERRHGRSLPAGLSYLEGQLMSFYLQDMELMTRYADLNRRAIATEILEGMGLTNSVDRKSVV